MEKMTAEKATQFAYRSETQAGILTAAAAERGCDCEPYIDWFTYARWQAQNMQVQKGESGVKLYRFVTKTLVDEKTGEEMEKTFPSRYTVFCRCQVKEK